MEWGGLYLLQVLQAQSREPQAKACSGDGTVYGSHSLTLSKGINSKMCIL